MVRRFNFLWRIMKWRMMFLTNRIWVLGTNYGYGEVLKEDAERIKRLKARDAYITKQGMELDKIRARLGL